MKYLTLERLFGDQEEEGIFASRCYWKEFEKISGSFPENFVLQFKRDALHDSRIQKIELLYRNDLKECVIFSLYDPYRDVKSKIICQGIRDFRVQLGGCNFPLHGEMIILYSEILPYKEKSFSYEILTEGYTIYFVFEKLNFFSPC